MGGGSSIYRSTMLMEPIGRGTYGAVYRGTCAGLDVAVKVLPLQTNTAEDIKREIQVRARVRVRVRVRVELYLALDVLTLTVTLTLTLTLTLTQP